MSEFEGKTFFSEHLKTSTGGINMAVDGSTSVTFSIGPPPTGALWHLARVLPWYEDNAGMRADKYGASDQSLANGILLRVASTGGATVTDLLDGDPIKKNGDWSKFCYDTTLLGWGNGNEILASRWTFAKAGTPLALTSTERLEMVIQDNLTPLVWQQAIVQGYKDR